LRLNTGTLSALVDTGAQFSCLRADIVDRLRKQGEPCRQISCDDVCVMADGRASHINRAVSMRVRLLSFSWCHNFKVLNEGPFPAILGLDFLRRTQMRIDVVTSKFSFAFAPHVLGSLSDETKGLSGRGDALIGSPGGKVTAMGQERSGHLDPHTLVEEFPAFFPPCLALLDVRRMRLSYVSPRRCCHPRIGVRLLSFPHLGIL
jgi:hypothetical protein